MFRGFTRISLDHFGISGQKYLNYRHRMQYYFFRLRHFHKFFCYQEDYMYNAINKG